MKRALLTLTLFLALASASQITLTITPPYFMIPVNNTVTVAVNVCCAPETVTLAVVTVGTNPVTVVRTVDLVVPKGAYPVNMIIKIKNEYMNYTTIAPLVLRASPPSVTVTDYAHLQVGYLEGTVAINATLQVGNFTPNWNNYVTVTKTVTVSYTVYSKEVITINSTITLTSIITSIKSFVTTVTKLVPELVGAEACKLMTTTVTKIVTTTKIVKKFAIPSVLWPALAVISVLKKRVRKR